MVPGDIVGAPSCFFDGALYSVRSLTNSVVIAWPLEELFNLSGMQPQLATKIFWSFCCDAAMSAEHVVVVGRRSARERIAHFLLRVIDSAARDRIGRQRPDRLPFSQDVICDALGLSLAYVNRELRRLAQDGLVIISDHKVEINDVEALSALADFEDHYLRPTPIDELIAPGVCRRFRPAAGGTSPFGE